MPQPSPHGDAPGPQPPHASPAQQPPATPAVFELGRQGLGGGIIIAVLIGGLGVATLTIGTVESINDDPPLAGLIIGGIFLLLGLSALYTPLFGERVRIVIDSAGARLENAGKKNNWSVTWDELASVTTWTTRTNRPDEPTTRQTFLQFAPVDPEHFYTDHPGLQDSMSREAGYRVPAGSGPERAPALDAALHTHAASRYT